LKAWFAARGLSLAKLGLALGVSSEGARVMLRSKTVNQIRFAQLRGLGIPVDLLPSPEFRKSGPKAGRARRRETFKRHPGSAIDGPLIAE